MKGLPSLEHFDDDVWWSNGSIRCSLCEREADFVYEYANAARSIVIRSCTEKVCLDFFDPPTALSRYLGCQRQDVQERRLINRSSAAGIGFKEVHEKLLRLNTGNPAQ